MIRSLIPVAAVLVLFSVVIAGCTSPTEVEIKPLPTPVPTSTPAVQPTVSVPYNPNNPVPTVFSTPEAVETLPPEQFVDLALTKEQPDATIHLLFNGGMGEIYVENVLLKVTLSNGQVVEQYMNNGERKPQRGDEVIVQGTRGTDRAEVFVTSSGKTYKIIDELLTTAK